MCGGGSFEAKNMPHLPNPSADDGDAADEVKVFKTSEAEGEAEAEKYTSEQVLDEDKNDITSETEQGGVTKDRSNVSKPDDGGKNLHGGPFGSSPYLPSSFFLPPSYWGDRLGTLSPHCISPLGLMALGLSPPPAHIGMSPSLQRNPFSHLNAAVSSSSEGGRATTPLSYSGIIPPPAYSPSLLASYYAQMTAASPFNRYPRGVLSPTPAPLGFHPAFMHPDMRNNPDLLRSPSASMNSDGSSQQSPKDRRPHVKKPLNAFMLFMKEMRQKVISECTLKESAAINQILGQKWHNLSREEQQKYYDMAKDAKEKHREQYPDWTARDNYAAVLRRKRKRRDVQRDPGEAGLKKCRARFGVEHQDKWCKPCKRKKKCILFKAGMDENNMQCIEQAILSGADVSSPSVGAASLGDKDSAGDFSDLESEDSAGEEDVGGSDDDLDFLHTPLKREKLDPLIKQELPCLDPDRTPTMSVRQPLSLTTPPSLTQPPAPLSDPLKPLVSSSEDGEPDVDVETTSNLALDLRPSDTSLKLNSHHHTLAI